MRWQGRKQSSNVEDRRGQGSRIGGKSTGIIGIIILLAPVFKPESGIGQLFAQSYLVGWFALVLGLAFIGQFLWNRLKK